MDELRHESETPSTSTTALARLDRPQHYWVLTTLATLSGSFVVVRAATSLAKEVRIEDSSIRDHANDILAFASIVLMLALPAFAYRVRQRRGGGAAMVDRWDFLWLATLLLPTVITGVAYQLRNACADIVWQSEARWTQSETVDAFTFVHFGVATALFAARVGIQLLVAGSLDRVRRDHSARPLGVLIVGIHSGLWLMTAPLDAMSWFDKAWAWTRFAIDVFGSMALLAVAISTIHFVRDDPGQVSS